MQPLSSIKQHCIGSSFTVRSALRLYWPCDNLKWLAPGRPYHLRCIPEKTSTAAGFAKVITKSLHTGRGPKPTVFPLSRPATYDEEPTTIGISPQASRTAPQYGKTSPGTHRLIPSKQLIIALFAIGCEHAIPAEFPNKPDRSFISPRPVKLRVRGRRRFIKWRNTPNQLTPENAAQDRFITRWRFVKNSLPNHRRRRVKQMLARADGYSPKRLQSVLAQYLHRIPMSQSTKDLLPAESAESWHQMDKNILNVFNEHAMALLHSKGYDAGDVVSWAAILTAESSEKAVLLLTALSTGGDPDPQGVQKRIPDFVLLFLLRRQHISTQALGLLVVHAWYRLGNRLSPDWVSATRQQMATEPWVAVPMEQKSRKLSDVASHHPPMSEPTIMTMIIRLLRHARKLSPALLPAISAILAVHVTGSKKKTQNAGQMDVKTSSRLSFLYNKILCLLALPSSQHPYRDIPFHQQAQFNLIRRMNQFEPALTINREGYRAVARVQLAHRKTLQERAWAAMKAKSWPPWKEDKLGIDADIGVESGISRANQALIRSEEAGYAPQDWEVSAKVLSGWDTDRSPTIQTRAIFPEYATARRSRRSSSPADCTTPIDDTWSARIQSTRTVDEAWACFLNYKDSGSARSLSVYYRMLEKIAYSQTRPCEGAQAGDGKEVAALPTDPRDRIYVRMAPPSMRAFFDAMIADGVRPSGRCLEFLLDQAVTIYDGLRYLKSSRVPPETVKLLLNEQKPDSEDAIKKLKQLAPYLFAAYVRFLCRFATSKMGAAWLSINPFSHAFRLVLACKSAYRPPWYTLLSTVMRNRNGIAERTVEKQGHGRDIAAWKSMLTIVHQMGQLKVDLDFEGFYILCVGLERAVLSSHHILQEPHPWIGCAKPGSSGLWWKEELAKWEGRQSAAEAILRKGPAELKTLFRRFVTGYFDDGLSNGYRHNGVTAQVLNNDIDSEVVLPRLLVVPAPAELHAFIRVLGVSKDHEGILDLLHWMVQFAMELRAVAAELRNGAIVMRRCLTAIRVFLEGHGQSVVTSEDGVSGQGPVVDRAPDSIIEQAFAEIQGVEDWGGWPTDEDVEEYCDIGANARGRET